MAYSRRFPFGGPSSGQNSVPSRCLPILSLATLTLLSACSSLSTPPGGLGVPNLEARSSKNRPVWIDRLGQWQKDHPGREYFVGTTTKEPDQESGRTDAYQNAVRSIAERIGERARSLYRETSSRNMDETGSGMDMSVRRHVTSLVTNEASARISGARVEDYFWQKFWEKDQEDQPPYSFYKYSVLVSIRKDLYDALLRNSLEGARRNASDPKVRSLLERMIHQSSHQ